MQFTGYQSTLILISVTAAYAAIFLLFQQRRSLQKQIKHLLTTAPKQVSGSFWLLEHSAQPFLVYSSTGVVTFANAAFTYLCPVVPGHTRIEQIDTHLGSQIASELHTSSPLHRHRVTFQRNGAELHYLAVTWPAHGPDTAQGRVLTLFNQTHSSKRQRSRTQFEVAIITYLSALTRSLREASGTTHRLGAENALHRMLAVQAQLSELESLTTYLEQSQPALQPSTRLTAIETAPVVREALSELRALCRERQIKVSSVLATNLFSLTPHTGFSLAIRSVLHAAIQCAKSGEQLRVSLNLHEGWVELSIHLPETSFTARQIELLHHLSPAIPGVPSAVRAQLLVAEQIASQVDGTLQVKSNPQEGTTLSLQFKAVGAGSGKKQVAA